LFCEKSISEARIPELQTAAAWCKSSINVYINDLNSTWVFMDLELDFPITWIVWGKSLNV